VKGDLERGRLVLRGRLARRGVTLSAGLLAAVAGTPAAGGPSPTLVQTTLAAAAGTPTPAVAALIGAARPTMIPRSVKALTAAVVVAGAALALAGPTAPRLGPQSKPPPVEKPAPAPAAPADPATTLTYAGKVLDHNGEPICMAKVWICGLNPGVIEYKQRTTTGPDGTFRFTVRRDEFGVKGVVPPGRSPPERYVHIGASAAGCGSATGLASQPEQRENVIIRLPKEEPVKGRVVDLEGKPVVGAKVSAYLRYARADFQGKPIAYDAPDEQSGHVFNVAPFEEGRHSATTDRDGRFTLSGLGHGWLYDLSIMGPTIVTARARLVARPQPPSSVGGTGLVIPERGPPRLTQYGSEFTHVATPAKPITGTVRERDGGPIAGARVYTPFTRDDDPSATTTTDEAGRYVLGGLPRGNYAIRVDAPRGKPYLETEFKVEADQPGTQPVTADFELERRPAVTGRVTDPAGKPVNGWVEYRPLAKNPALKTAPLLAEPQFRQHVPSARLDADGRFFLPALPGPGVLLVRADGEFQTPRLAKEHRVAGVAHDADPELLDTRPLPAWVDGFNSYRLVDVPADKDLEVAIALESDRSRPLAIEFPDGKPRDVTAVGLHPNRPHGEGVFAGTKAVVRSLEEGSTRRLFLMTNDGKLAAAVAVDGSASGPVAVKLRPTGSVTGRLIDKDGKAVKGPSFQVVYEEPGRPGVVMLGGLACRLSTPAEQKRSRLTTGYLSPDKLEYVTGPEKADDNGVFRLSGVIPDAAFELRVQLLSPPDKKGSQFIRGYEKVGGGTVKPGGELHLGDLTAPELPKK
jgi:protocatechuate 3,4-dioxygenase beta subunit